jgi:hypothetical protein
LANIIYIIFRNVEIFKTYFFQISKYPKVQKWIFKEYFMCWNEYFKIIQHKCVEMAKVLGSTTSPTNT